MMKKYKIFPKKFSGVTHMTKSSLEEIARHMENILGEGESFYNVISDGIEIVASENNMERLIERTGLREACVIEEEEVKMQ